MDLWGLQSWSMVPPVNEAYFIQVFYSWSQQLKGLWFLNQFDNGRTFQSRIVFNSSYVFYFHRFTAKRRQNKSLSEKITTFVCQISRHVEKRTWVTFPLVIYHVLFYSGFCCWTSNLRFRSKWRTMIWKGEWQWHSKSANLEIFSAVIHLYITTYRINVLTHFIHRSKSFLGVVVDNSGNEAIVVQFTF